jgi:endonuclease/exonuclease/phosphatase family metal-dependent hydrolase
MHTDYRKQLQLQEILGFQADVVCLQELDTRAFESYFQPHLADHGCAPLSRSGLIKNFLVMTFTLHNDLN